MQGVKEKALELLHSGVVQRVLGWRTGEFFYDLTPGVFIAPEEVEQDFVYNIFSGANLSKYLIAESKKEGKIAVFLKPCDSFSFVQLQKEHRINRENIYAVGVQCDGKCDGESLRAAGCEGVSIKLSAPGGRPRGILARGRGICNDDSIFSFPCVRGYPR